MCGSDPRISGWSNAAATVPARSFVTHAFPLAGDDGAVLARVQVVLPVGSSWARAAGGAERGGYEGEGVRAIATTSSDSANIRP